MRLARGKAAQGGVGSLEGVFWLFAGATLLLMLVPFDKWPLFDGLRVLLVIGLLACWALLNAWQNVHGARLMENMPTSRVRSAAQGYVELVGTACAVGAPLRCPVGKVECVWWEYDVRKKQFGDDGLKTIASSTSDAVFGLQDDTAQCYVLPNGARVVTHHDLRWYGSQAEPDRVPGGVERFFSRLGFTFGLAPYRYDLRLIRPGDPLYTLGEFLSEHGSDEAQHSLVRPSDTAKEFLLSTTPQGQLTRRQRVRALLWFIVFVGIAVLFGVSVIGVSSKY